MSLSSRLFIMVLASTVGAGCSAAVTQPPTQKPAVVVLISVDQLRADLLTHFGQYYTDGFRRLLDQGAVFDAVHDHGITETAAGHAALSTGTVPARSGIIGNDWEHRVGSDWVGMYTVADSTTPIVGFPDMEGMSPRNLLRSGLGDWVTQSNPAAKVVSIAGKDRSAVLLAGHARGEVYWYDPGEQRFITSTYYTNEYPAWVDRFNNEVLPGVLDSTWRATAPAGARALARPDTASYEADGVHTHFPHIYANENEGGRESFGTWVSRTPYPDRATLELAKIAVRETGIGADSATDLLSLGFSQADRIGHRFGPLSREQLENLLHLDQVLGDLFRFLDEQIGEGRWVAALSADHGAVTMPEWTTARGGRGARLTRENREQISAISEAARQSAAPGEENAAVARALGQLPFLAGAYTREELASGEPRDSIARLLQRSFHPDRMKSDLARRGVLPIGQPGIYMSTSVTGTGHGTPWYYDRSVPLIFLGAGVQPGRRAEVARTIDAAPTLALLGGIPAPGDLDGETLRIRSAP